jgi:putative addiction module killer protein
VLQVVRTREYSEWFAGLRDQLGKARIAARVARLEQGNPGITRGVGSGVQELKIDAGPGYRVYYVRQGDLLILLLCGGDKSSQDRDILRAKEILRRIAKEGVI